MLSDSAFRAVKAAPACGPHLTASVQAQLDAGLVDVCFELASPDAALEPPAAWVPLCADTFCSELA